LTHAEKRHVPRALPWVLVLLGGYLVAGVLPGKGFAQENAPDSLEAPEIRFEAKLDRTQVPLNRTLRLDVEVRWRGELDRYEVADVEEPVVRNLEIVGSGSANRVETDASGRPVAVKSFQYLLRPKELGMAYVEGLTILYTDTKTGKSHRLMTQRLQAEVVDPVREGGARVNPFVYVAGAVAMAAAGVVYYFRRTRGGVEAPVVEREPTLEEKLLSELREGVRPQDPAFDVKEGYARVSKLARRYLAERYGLSGLELTTNELLRELEGKVADERLLTQAEELLRRCDQVKFGGEAGDASEVSRLAGVLEFWLTRPQRAAAD